MHFKIFVPLLLVIAVFACCFVGIEGGRRGGEQRKQKEPRKQKEKKTAQKGEKVQDNEKSTKSYLRNLEADYVNKLPKNPEEYTPQKNMKTAFNMFKNLCSDGKKGGKWSIVAQIVKAKPSKVASESFMKCCGKVNNGADPEEFMDDCEDLVKGLSTKVTETPKYGEILRKVQKEEQKELRKQERKRNGWKWWGSGKNDKGNGGKNSDKKGRKNKRRRSRDVGNVEEANPFLYGFSHITLNGRSKRGISLTSWTGERIVRVTEHLTHLMKKGRRSRQKRAVHYNNDDEDDEHHVRDKRASFAQGILFTFLVLLGLFFAAIAFSCFLSIFSPCFLFALAGTFIFGAGAWFCLKAAEAVIESSESVEHEYDVDFYGDAAAGGYGGGGADAYYDSGSYEYYDNGVNHGGAVPADHLHGTRP